MFMAQWLFAVAFSCACMYSSIDDTIINNYKNKSQHLMTSMQNASYIMEILLEYKDIADIFEDFK